MLGVLASLAQAKLSIIDPGAALFDDLVLNRQIEEIALAADAVVVHEIELGLLERRGHLVLDDTHLDARADRLFAVLDAGDLADIETDGAIKLEGQAARGRLRIAEHDADLLADLVDEDHAGLGPRDRRVENAHRLAHEPGLKADVRIADLAFHLGARHQRRHRVDNDDIHGIGLDQHFGNLERFFRRGGLAHQQAL